MLGKWNKLCKIQWCHRRLYWIGCVYVFLIVVALFNGNSRCKYNMPDVYSYQEPGSDKCFVDISTLGLVTLNMLESPSMREVERQNFHVTSGGMWKPRGCHAVQRVAIIIPYRDRLSHLTILLQRLHPMLQKQKLSYRIFVVEQSGDAGFNSGRLQNIGVTEAMKADYDCLILHDVDLIPEHDANLYVCDDQFRHLTSAIDEMRYHVMYYNSVGGVAAINYNNLLRMNGHNNNYWGWGSEDDDFGARSAAAGLLITRPPEHIGRYKMVRHPKRWREDDRYSEFLTWRSKWKADGLNTIEGKYRVISTQKHRLYTNISVDLGPAPATLPDESHLPRESLWWLLKFFFP